MKRVVTSEMHCRKQWCKLYETSTMNSEQFLLFALDLNSLESVLVKMYPYTKGKMMDESTKYSRSLGWNDPSQFMHTNNIKLDLVIINCLHITQNQPDREICLQTLILSGSLYWSFSPIYLHRLASKPTFRYRSSLWDRIFAVSPEVSTERVRTVVKNLKTFA